MRYNVKQEHKQVRFDRTLLHPSNSNWHASEIKILGTKPLPNLPDIWPSDHFGLISKFNIN